MEQSKISNNGVYDYARDNIELPVASLDKIARIVISRFNEAARWQGMELVGSKSLKEVMRDCYEQYNGILCPADREIVDELGVNAYVNITAMKSGLVQSYLLESLVHANQIPWAIEPTPVVSLSRESEEIAVQELMATMQASQGTELDLISLARNIKDNLMRAEQDHAKTCAENMERLITDQCMEGDWNNAMYSFTADFTIYPFAVLQGPVPVVRARPVWKGNTYTIKQEVFYEFKSVSPWDFWYSPDSPDTQRGTGVFVRQRWTRRQLLDAMRLPSYNADAIKTVLEESSRADYIFRWLSENPEQPDDKILQWNDCTATIDVLIHYGYFRGSELRDYGISDVEDIEFYNAQITVIGKHTIQVMVQKNPNLNIRPIFTSSFYKTQNRIPSFSIAQRVRDVERAYMSSLRYLMMNAYNASGPITEADYTRLAKYMSNEDINKIVPNTIYLASADVPTANPALRFYTVPSAMPQYQSLMTYFMDLADKVTNIPAALHGTAVGSGANRTFRGAAMLQGNAVKAIQASVANIDQYIFKPMGELLYNYNMVYSDDDSVKGDCKITACGATGLMQREINRQNSYEILQLVGSAGQQIMQLPKGTEIITWALKNVLGNMGIPKDLLNAKDSMPGGVPQQDPMQQAQAPEGQSIQTGTELAGS